MISRVLLIFSILLMGCASSQPLDDSNNTSSQNQGPNSSGSSSRCQEDFVEYRVTFEATWSSRTHPIDFPSNPHFSRLIGGTHNDQVSFWKPGSLASSGIESMAETGSVTPLNLEVQEAVDEGRALTVLSGGGIADSPGSTTFSFIITPQFPLVTLVSMIAPSPDWFVGVQALSLCENGGWINEISQDLYPYDAGTDSGETFNSANADTNPAEPIQAIVQEPLGRNGQTDPLGRFIFERI